MAFPWKLLVKGGGVLTQAADALIWPDQAGYGSDVVRAVDEAVGDAGFLQKLQVSFTRSSGATEAEDIAICTWHFAKVAGEDFVNTWSATDAATIEARFDTWWTSVKVLYPSWTKLAEYRWYKTGPAHPISGPAWRITAKNTPGSSTNIAHAAPQVSINVSEHTRIRKHWGRFYLPAPNSQQFDNYGRIAAATVPAINTYTGALYVGLKGDGYPVVVYSRAKPQRSTKGGATLPPAPARAFVVESIKVDDIADVIRSRRHSRAVTVATTAIT